MEKVHIFDLEGTRFPAGRRTRVVIGQNGAITGDKFCQGYVVIDPNGKIPEHEHETVESYTIIKGTGRMTVYSLHEEACARKHRQRGHAYDFRLCAQRHCRSLGAGKARRAEITASARF